MLTDNKSGQKNMGTNGMKVKRVLGWVKKLKTNLFQAHPSFSDSQGD